MTELKLKTSEKGLRGTYIYDEHIDKNSDKKVKPLCVAASEKHIQDLLNTLKVSPELVKNIRLIGEDIEFVVKDEMKVVLINGFSFKQNTNFKFLFDKIKIPKRCKLVKEIIRGTIITCVIATISLTGTIVVNATEEEFNKTIDNGVISSSDLSIGNELLDRKFDVKKQTSLLIQKLEEESKLEKISVVVRPREEREKEALENFYRSIYKSKEEEGFVVTVGNKTYDLSPYEKALFAAIVAAESDQSLDDALATGSSIFNRCEDPAWVASYGTNPISQITASGQYSVYSSGDYEQYLKGVPKDVQQAVDDLFAGVRNTDYTSFRADGSNYNGHKITEHGNIYSK